MQNLRMPPYIFFPFHGLEIYSGTLDSAVQYTRECIVKNRHIYVCVAGAHGLAESYRQKSIFTAHKQAAMIVPDGVPLVWVGNALGYKNTHRIYGPDLALSIANMSEQRGYSIYLYGSTTKTLIRLKGALKALYPSLRIIGSYAPPFRTLTREEHALVIRRINRANPNIVFVGLGTPKQELWMNTFSKSLNANVLLGIGAAFDFIAGTKKQAPIWMRQVGLEWLFRLIQEPTRLFSRYIVSNIMFVYMAAGALFTKKPITIRS